MWKLWKYYTKVEVAEHERVLLFRRDNFVRVLMPGVWRLWDPLGRLHTDKYDLTNPVFEHPIDEFLVKHHEALSDHLQVIELGDDDVGLVYVDEKLRDVLSPAMRKIYWKGVHEVRVDTYDVAEDYTVPRPLVSRLGHLRGVERARLAVALEYLEVPDNHVGLLFVNGKLDRTLEPGPHAFWKFGRTIQTRVVDTRLQSVEVSGQEILTKDKVSLRLNLTASYRVADVLTAFTQISDFEAFLYKELQFGLREAVGTQTLDEILAGKEELGRVIDREVKERVAEYGIVVSSIGVKDVILPGEMKTLLNQVVEAEKQAEANLIRRREETAATRSLHNTAKMLERSPTLLRLKELEALEKVTERIDTLTVFGGLDGVLHQLVKLKED